MAEIYARNKGKIAKIPLREEDYDDKGQHTPTQRILAAGGEVGTLMTKGNKKAFVPKKDIERAIAAGLTPIGPGKTVVTQGDAGEGWAKAEAAARGIADYGTLGFGEEVSTLAAPFTGGTPMEQTPGFKEQLAIQREAQAKSREEHPWLYHGAGLGVSLGAGIAGGLKGGAAATLQQVAKEPAKVLSKEFGKQVARSAGEGAVVGGISGLGESEALSKGEGLGGTVRDIAKGAAGGAAVSGALPVVGKGFKGATGLLPGRTQIQGKDKLNLYEKTADLANRAVARMNSVLLGKDTDDYLRALRDPQGRLKAKLTDTATQAKAMTGMLEKTEAELDGLIGNAYGSAVKKFADSSESVKAIPGIIANVSKNADVAMNMPEITPRVKGTFDKAMMAMGTKNRGTLDAIAQPYREAAGNVLLLLPQTAKTAKLYAKNPALAETYLNMQMFANGKPIRIPPQRLLDNMNKYKNEIAELTAEALLGPRKAVGNTLHPKTTKGFSGPAAMSAEEAATLNALYSDINDAIRATTPGEELKKFDALYSTFQNQKRSFFSQFKAKSPTTGKPALSEQKVMDTLNKPETRKIDQQKMLENLRNWGQSPELAAASPEAAKKIGALSDQLGSTLEDIGLRKSMAALEQSSGGPSGRAALLGTLGTSTAVGGIPLPVAVGGAVAGSPVLFPATYLRAQDTVNRALAAMSKTGALKDVSSKRVAPYIAAKLWLDQNKQASEEEINAKMKQLGIQ